ncbi:undecaprenyl-diphosphate phosphatase [Mycolicibacterium aichiense]|uniref:undecaprenyl-diphosphate phosphatase n=1 Tax=Mycolicibacterium aichiense TaxID=1799 RepID=UPI003D66C079
MSSHLSYAEALLVGALQGVTELFPVSSLGHSVLLPAVLGGRWAVDLNVSTPESPYLAFIVGLHVATAAALLVFFWRDWVRIVSGFVTSLRYRRIQTPAERLAWLIVLATIPVGLSGLALEHVFRTTLGKPVPAAVFLTLNGLALYGAELMRRRTRVPTTACTGESTYQATPGSMGNAVDDRLSQLPMPHGVLIGCAQILALLPGISRSGITMVAGMTRELSHEEAARFSFLLATPIILAAGLLKIPDLFGPLGNGIHGEVLVGSLASFVSAYFAVRFLTRYFETRTLTPFAIYCVLAGAASLLWLTLR